MKLAFRADHVEIWSPINNKSTRSAEKSVADRAGSSGSALSSGDSYATAILSADINSPVPDDSVDDQSHSGLKQWSPVLEKIKLQTASDEEDDEGFWARPPWSADDIDLCIKLTTHVDYLEHDWTHEDFWATWKHIGKAKNSRNPVRLENALWRTWTRAKNNLALVPASRLNWHVNPT